MIFELLNILIYPRVIEYLFSLLLLLNSGTRPRRLDFKDFLDFFFLSFSFFNDVFGRIETIKELIAHRCYLPHFNFQLTVAQAMCFSFIDLLLNVFLKHNEVSS